MIQRHPVDHSAEQIETLLRKYDRPGPRYTSYPTAPAWSDDFGPEQLRASLKRVSDAAARGEGKPLSLYVHVPFCHQRCLYCGCNVVISPKDKVSPRYMDVLEREIDMMRAQLPAPGKVVQIHLGGGTPTYLRPRQLERLQRMIVDRFDVDPEAEISIEVDPVVTDEDHIRTLRRLGYNRISMGVQDLDPRVQEAVHRVQPQDLTERFYAVCREAGFLSVNMDLIYGLPFQTPQTFGETVDQVIRWAPDRVAVFNYAHVPWIKPHQKLMPEEALPAPDSKFAIFVETRRRFEAAGYEAIGLDHFALPDDELAEARRDEVLRRNFMGYTTKPETDILAFGVSSISDVGGAYAQNFTRLPHYYRAVEGGELPTHRGVHMSEDDLIRRDVIMEIMCNFVLQKPRIEQRYGIDFDAYFASQDESLASLESDGLIRREPDRIEVTELGQLLVRNVAMVFDAYLRPPSESGTPLYSRTV